MVTPAFVHCLKLLENVGGLCLPFPTGTVNVVCSIGISVSARPLVFQLVGFLLGTFNILRYGGQVPLYRRHSCHLPVLVLELTQRRLDVRLDLCCKSFMRLGEILGTGDDALPWHLEDAARSDGELEILDGLTYPRADAPSCCGLRASLRKPAA